MHVIRDTSGRRCARSAIQGERCSHRMIGGGDAGPNSRLASAEIRRHILRTMALAILRQECWSTTDAALHNLRYRSPR